MAEEQSKMQMLYPGGIRLKGGSDLLLGFWQITSGLCFLFCSLLFRPEGPWKKRMLLIRYHSLGNENSLVESTDRSFRQSSVCVISRNVLIF